MIEIRLTGGYNDALTTDVVDLFGRDLTEATVRSALWPEGQDWPPAGSPAWSTPDAELGVTGGTVSALVPTSQAAGHFYWWLHVTLGALSVVFPVRDPDDPEHPWHIWVH